VTIGPTVAAELYAALRERKPVPPLTGRDFSLTIDDAYHVSLALLDMLKVSQPEFGFLTDAMEVQNGGRIQISTSLIQPRAEAEIAFILRLPLKGPGVTEQQVLEATESIVPSFEIVDSRIEDWKIRIQDTIADNASCGMFILGRPRLDPHAFDLSELEARVHKNGQFISSGKGSAVEGSPLAVVAWLANTLESHGVALDAGYVILSGSLVPLEPASVGDHFSMTLNSHGEELGSTSVRFV
jgi:2-oxopent-4-enoate/cis-2-oxohex-4-enoate hydratase